MDRDMALLNASRTVFPTASRIVCAWHIEKNVLIRATQEIKDKEVLEQFMKDWQLVVSSST